MSDAAAAVTELLPVTPQHAFQRWLQLDRPSFRVLASLLKQEGFQATAPTLNRMKDRHPQWLAMCEDRPDPGSNRLNVMLLQLKGQAKDVDAAVFEGLGARLIGKAVAIIDQMNANQPEDLHRILDAIDRVKGFAHDARGASIARGTAGNGVMNGNPPASILSMVAPKVAVSPFNGAAKKNGA